MEDQKRLGQTYTYFGVLTLFIYLIAPNQYLVDIVTSYMLKDQLHATATEVSTFRLWTAFPIYVAFLFGFVRDRWNPLGLRDRGYFIIFGALTAASFLALAFLKLSYVSLFIGLFAVMFFFRFISSAYQGLMALIGQERLMSGRMSALWNIVLSLPVAAGAAGSGWMAEHLKPQQSFLILAAGAVAILLAGVWKPAAVYEGTYEAPQAVHTSFWDDVKRLVRHWPVYPAVLAILMFQFAPGANTPLQYHLTNDLHASDEIYGYYLAIFSMAFVPVFFLYGWLCQRVAFGRLLFWGTVITIPQMIPLAFINTPEAALWWAAVIGALGGVFGAAVYDLAFRSCPPGLQGTMMMLIEAGNLIATRGSDWVGSKIYGLSPTHGFQYCVIAITVVYALILPVILLIPKEILATRDGEALA
jgi:MFS family permease